MGINYQRYFQNNQKISKFKNLQFVSLSIFLSLLIFWFAPGNLDSQTRIDNFYKIDLFDFRIFFLIFQEPLVLVISQILEIFGVLSIFSIQLALYILIMGIALWVLSARFAFFPLLLLVPSVWLLFFNIQPMAISLLISYCIVMPNHGVESSRLGIKKDLFAIIIALGFHWVAVVIIPIVFIKYKRYFLLGIGLICMSVMVLYLENTVGQNIQSKFEIYKAVSYNKNSADHVQIAIFLALGFVAMNFIFRPNNQILRFKSYFYLYVVLIVAAALEIAGYKAASRLAFILDIWIFFDLIIFWIPKKIKKHLVFTFEGGGNRGV